MTTLRKYFYFALFTLITFSCSKSESSVEPQDNFVEFGGKKYLIVNKSLSWIPGLLFPTNPKNYARIKLSDGENSFNKLDNLNFEVTFDIYISRAGNGFLVGKYPITDTFFGCFSCNGYDIPENSGWGDGYAKLLKKDAPAKNRDYYSHYNYSRGKPGNLIYNSDGSFNFEMTLVDGQIIKGNFKL